MGLVAIGLVSIAHGVLHIVLAFQVKNLPEHLDELAQQFDAGSTRRPEAA